MWGAENTPDIYHAFIGPPCDSPCGLPSHLVDMGKGHRAGSVVSEAPVGQGPSLPGRRASVFRTGGCEGLSGVCRALPSALGPHLSQAPPGTLGRMKDRAPVGRPLLPGWEPLRSGVPPAPSRSGVPAELTPGLLPAAAAGLMLTALLVQREQSPPTLAPRVPLPAPWWTACAMSPRYTG